MLLTTITIDLFPEPEPPERPAVGVADADEVGVVILSVIELAAGEVPPLPAPELGLEPGLPVVPCRANTFAPSGYIAALNECVAQD